VNGSPADSHQCCAMIMTRSHLFLLFFPSVLVLLRHIQSQLISYLECVAVIDKRVTIDHVLEQRESIRHQILINGEPTVWYVQSMNVLSIILDTACALPRWFIGWAFDMISIAEGT
jgi:hypothetical protein